MKNSSWIVKGYEFQTKEETQNAFLEYSKIKKIEKKIDYSNLKMLQQLYEKSVEEKIFKTVVGYEFLRKIQIILLENKISIEAIPIDSFLADDHDASRKEQLVNKEKFQQIKKKNQVLSYCILVLSVLVIAMFVISMTGNKPTVLNYERALQNKYAQWEEELSQREDAVKEKERELRINSQQ